MSLTHIAQGIKGVAGMGADIPLPCPAPVARLPQGWSKGRLLSLIDEIAKEIGLTAGDLRILHRITRKTRAEDYESATRSPICYERQADMAASVGVNSSYWRKIEGKLHHLGLIRRDTGANGYRGGTDGPDGARAYAGLSLEPLIERLEEFVQIKEMQDAIAQKASWYRLEISTRRRRLALIVEALGADHSFTRAYEDEKVHWKRPRDYGSLVALSEAHERLEKLIAAGESAVQGSLPPTPSQRLTKAAARPSQNMQLEARLHSLDDTKNKPVNTPIDETPKESAWCSNSSGAALQYERHHIQLTTDINKSMCSSEAHAADQKRTADKSAEDKFNRAPPNGSAHCLENKHREAQSEHKSSHLSANADVETKQTLQSHQETAETAHEEQAGQSNNSDGVASKPSQNENGCAVPRQPADAGRGAAESEADHHRARLQQIAERAGVKPHDGNKIKENGASHRAGRSDNEPPQHIPEEGSWAAFEAGDRPTYDTRSQGGKAGRAQSSEDFVETLSLARMQALCSEQMALYITHMRDPGTPRRAYDFENATLQRCKDLGINPSALEEAIQVMGWKAACLAVIIIDRNCEHPNPAYQIKAPGGALRAFTRKHQKGLLDLRASVFGIWGRE